jgi:glycosyltransferase involved in cell wall biosynthesis
VVTLRGGATPQNATYLLLNVLSEFTDVSLVTVELSEDSDIHGEYDVSEISGGAMGSGLASTILLFMLNQLRICREIRRSDKGVVYFFGGLAYVVPVVFSKIIGRKVVVQPRGDVPLTLRLSWEERFPASVARFLAGVVKVLEGTTARLADRIVTYTPAMAEELGLDRFEEKLYPDGTRYIETDRFAPKTPYEERDRVVGMVGRLDIEKGVGEIADAVGIMSEETRFLFVGDGELRGELEDELHGDIQRGRVEITGWVDHDEIPEYLNRMKLLVLASEPTEGLPTVIQEAFACGTPVYATPVSAVPDVVKEGESGFHMTERGPESIAEGIEEILRRDDLPEISENCRGFAVDKYSFDASVDRFRRLLEGV